MGSTQFGNFHVSSLRSWTWNALRPPANRAALSAHTRQEQELQQPRDKDILGLGLRLDQLLTMEGTTGLLSRLNITRLQCS
jgi:hypothetical protein